MDWRGLDWAIPVFELTTLVLPVYAFVLFHRRVKRTSLNRWGALGRYAAVVTAPVVVYALFFVTLLGLEEWLRISLMSEGLGRSFLLLVGLGLAVAFVSSLLFGFTLLFTKTQVPASDEGRP